MIKYIKRGREKPSKAAKEAVDNLVRSLENISCIPRYNKIIIGDLTILERIK